MAKPNREQYSGLEKHISKLHPMDILVCYEQTSNYLASREKGDLSVPLGEALWQGIYAFLDVMGEMIRVCPPKATARAMSVIAQRIQPKAARAVNTRINNIAALVDQVSAIRADELEAQNHVLLARIAELESQIGTLPTSSALEALPMETITLPTLIDACSLTAYARQYGHTATRVKCAVTLPAGVQGQWQTEITHPLSHLRGLPAIHAGRVQHLAFKAKQVAA